MTLFITLTLAEADTGPFNLFSDADGYLSAMAVNVSKAALLAGYSISDAPDGTTIVRVKSIGVCTTVLDIPVGITTTTTTSSSTTSTTTTSGPQVFRVHQVCCVPNDLTVRYVDIPTLSVFGPNATFTAVDGKPYSLIDTILVPGVPDIFQSGVDTFIYADCAEWNTANFCS